MPENDAQTEAAASLARTDAREQLATQLVTEYYGDDDTEVNPMDGDPIPALESVDGGYWIGARIWIDADAVEQALPAAEAARES